MTGAMKVTLIAIVVVLIGMAGSFIWFVANWDKEAEQPVGFHQSPAHPMTEDRRT